MNLPKLKSLSPKFKNLYTIGRVAYEATGNKYFLSLAAFAGQSLNNGINWFELYYQMRNHALQEIAKVDSFKYNLICNGKEVPFLYNSL